MKRISLNKSSLITAAFLSLSPALVFAADSGDAYITGTNPTTIKVKSNGQEYTQLDYFGNFSIVGKLEYDTGITGRIKSWKAEPVIVNGYGIATPVPGTSAYKQSKSYSAFNRPKSINVNLGFTLPSSMIKNAAIAMCNWQANTLRGQGKSNHHIFGQHRYVSFNISMKYSVDSNGAGSGSQVWHYYAPHELKVRCSKWQGSQGPDTSSGIGMPAPVIPVGISNATMQLKEIASAGGTCRVATQTRIVADTAKATIKYRFVHSSGQKSGVFTVKTKANKIAIVSHKWDIPNKPGTEKGWVRIEGVSPDFKSNRAHYSMRCRAKPAGGFAPKPKKPKIRIPLGGNSALSN